MIASSSSPTTATPATELPRRWRVVPGAILALFAALCLMTSLLNPLGEGYDEWAHFAYIRYIVTDHRLPTSGQRLVPEVGWDATHHPPLYYLIGAAATSWVDMSDNLRPVLNPYAYVGRSYNGYIHTHAEDWPFHGSALGMYVARCVSTLMGVLTLWFAYRAAGIVFARDRRLAIAAMGMTAFIPQFVFTHSIVTNDAAVTLFSTLSLWCMLRMAQRPSIGRGIGLWSAVIAAFLSKANGVALIPVAALVTGYALWHSRARLGRRRMVLAGLAAALALTGAVVALLLWEHENTYLLTHHSSVTGAIERYIVPALESSRRRHALYDWGLLPAGLTYMFQTFWASFGLGNVPAGQWFYWLMGAVCVAGAAGSVLGLLRASRAARQRMIIPLLCGLALFVPPVFLIVVAKYPFVSPGRYMMPAAPILGIVLTGGLCSLSRRPWRRWLPLGLAGALLIASALMPWAYIRPAYARARILTEAQVQAIATPVEARYGGGMELVGYRVETQDPQPGKPLTVALYWRCLATMPINYTVSVQALDLEGHAYGGIDDYPGAGSYPTTLWAAGQIIEDRHTFTLGSDLPAPNTIRIKIDVYDLDTGFFVPIISPEEIRGQQAVTLGRIGVGPTPTGLLPLVRHPLATFAGSLQLLDVSATQGLHPGERVKVSLTWRCTEPVSEDYTGFVHLVDAAGTMIAQDDGQPVEGRYPTSLWRKGDVIHETRSLEVPKDAAAGEYSLSVGWYLLETGERAPGSDAAGSPLANDEYLAPVTLTESVAP